MSEFTVRVGDMAYDYYCGLPGKVVSIGENYITLETTSGARNRVEYRHLRKWIQYREVTLRFDSDESGSEFVSRTLKDEIKPDEPKELAGVKGGVRYSRGTCGSKETTGEITVGSYVVSVEDDIEPIPVWEVTSIEPRNRIAGVRLGATGKIEGFIGDFLLLDLG